MNQTMKKLEKMGESDHPILMRILFGLDSPTPVPQNLDDYSEEIRNLEFVDPTLNESQIDAIRFALASREIALIHGPPGVSSHKNPDTTTAKCLTRLAKRTP